MPRAVRHINEIRTLDALFQTGPMSRADLARELGLTRSTASSIVSALVLEGLVSEDETDIPGRGNRTGRPGTYVRLRPEHAIFLGAYLGVGHKTVVAIDLNAQVIARTTTSSDLNQTDPDTAVSDLVSLIRSVIHRLPVPESVRGLSVTVPGMLDHDGNIFLAPILRWTDVPILQMLRTRFPEVRVIEAENDANAFAMAEMYRAGKSAPTEAIYLFLDAGVGGAVVSNGQLVRGHDGFAGEIGHIFVGDEGFVAMGALAGSLESFVGREAILARYRFHGGVTHSIDDFLAALAAGAEPAIATATDWSRYLGRGLATLTSVFNPARIVLGGPISSLLSFSEHGVLATMRKHLLPGQPLPIIELSSLGAEGPAIGAAAILHRRTLSFDEELVFHGVRNEVPTTMGVRTSGRSRE